MKNRSIFRLKVKLWSCLACLVIAVIQGNDTVATACFVSLIVCACFIDLLESKE